ncbi:CLOCK-interacting pacemaker [Trichomycterus rosablanca]|uniref:CLOCK-interacting pacemaker n=1 Tax=Trichomycterus rosablanca TaxID=2290929 RepID=UPI002F35F69B
MSSKIKEDGLVTAMGRPKTKRLEKSKPDTERDSGFSDASSEHLSVVDQTDSEDAGRPVVPGSRSKSSQLAVIGGSFQSLSPMIIMNNVLLKQPGDNPSSLKQWGFGSAVEVVQQPQVVFLQPVISQRKALEQKGPLSKRRKHKKYLPIRKSYPKIAPHPGDSPRSSCSSSTSTSSSRTTASVRSSNSSSTCWECPQVDKQQGSSTPNRFTPTRHLPVSPQPHTPLAEFNTGTCPAVEKPATGRLGFIAEPTDMNAKVLQTPPQAISKDDMSQNSDSDSSKRKRFCNTYNILSKSGLLGITLRTKDLIRQNRRTQAEIDKLREHTNLFVEALQRGDLHIWSKLQLSMQEGNEKEKTLNTGQESI